MIIRFQADADLNHNIVVGVLRREPKIDFQNLTNPTRSSSSASFLRSQLK